MTIATGWDVGQMSLEELKSSGLPSSIINKVKDFIFEYNLNLFPAVYMANERIKEALKRYSPFDLTDEEDYLVNEQHHPWTHNPAHLCQVYLPVKEGSTKDYFSDEYELNQFMEDTLNGNFIYVDNRAEPR